MWENSNLIGLCYCLFLQVTFINTKSQLFSLKNNKIAFSQIDSFDFFDDPIFSIIITERNGIDGVWTKDSSSGDMFDSFDTISE